MRVRLDGVAGCLTALHSDEDSPHLIALALCLFNDLSASPGTFLFLLRLHLHGAFLLSPLLSDLSSVPFQTHKYRAKQLIVVPKSKEAYTHLLVQRNLAVLTVTTGHYYVQLIIIPQCNRRALRRHVPRLRRRVLSVATRTSPIGRGGSREERDRGRGGESRGLDNCLGRQIWSTLLS